MGEEIEVLVDGGEASAGPPLGPALGPTGVNVMQVVEEINDRTSAFEGMQVPVKVLIDDDDNFEIEVGTPPTSALIKEELGIESGAGEPNRETVADLSMEQAIQVAERKKPDLLGRNSKTRTLEVLGTANSLGVSIDGKEPQRVQDEIKQGRHDDAFDDV
jgi:large subunit ribosomal protein L11